MNIEQAKAIPVAKILEKLNKIPTRKSNHQSWYFPPWREERTASLHVHDKNNWWYDFGIGIGGDAIAFVQQHLKSTREAHTVADALRWLQNMVGDTAVIKPVQAGNIRPAKHKLQVKSVKPIQHVALANYLDKRGIPLSVAETILKEVRVQNQETKKNIFALGLQNEESGWEIRNPLMKSCVGTKAISFIRGKDAKPTGIHVFEGVMDYLSILVQGNGRPLREDVIILNSIACLRQATPYIKGYGYTTIRTWMDNDLAGKQATQAVKEFAATEEGLVHKPMNKTYAPYKDVNAWHMVRLGL